MGVDACITDDALGLGATAAAAEKCRGDDMAVMDVAGAVSA